MSDNFGKVGNKPNQGLPRSPYNGSGHFRLLKRASPFSKFRTVFSKLLTECSNLKIYENISLFRLSIHMAVGVVTKPGLTEATNASDHFRLH